MPIEINDDVRIILSNMKQDEIAIAVKNDPVICDYIRRMFITKGGEQNHKKNEIHNNAREVSRLLVQLRKNKNKKCGLQDFFDASRYNEIISAVKYVAGFDENIKMYQAPELTRKLDGHINKCATIVLSKAIVENNKYLTEQLERFIKVHKMEYNVEIGAQAHRNRLKKTKEIKPNYYH